MMTYKNKNKLTRRDFLKDSAIAAAAVTTGLGAKPLYASMKKRKSSYRGKKVIILGIDGMDPRLSERLMNAGMLPIGYWARVFLPKVLLHGQTS